MRTIPLAAVPNQQVTVNIDENRWTIRIKQATTSIIADITLNDEPLLLGMRVSVGTPIIPFRHLATNGNFLLIVDGEYLPDWHEFGTQQVLVYVAPGELSGDVELDWSVVQLPPPVAVGTLFLDGSWTLDGEFFLNGQRPL
ncbi:structural protein [Pseudomonas phage vB_PcuM_ KLEP17-4]|nr:structural protein [Pseudomonas phage vB_PcuM_ KLEP17-4]